MFFVGMEGEEEIWGKMPSDPLVTCLSVICYVGLQSDIFFYTASWSLQNCPPPWKK